MLRFSATLCGTLWKKPMVRILINWLLIHAFDAFRSGQDPEPKSKSESINRFFLLSKAEKNFRRRKNLTFLNKNKFRPLRWTYRFWKVSRANINLIKAWKFTFFRLLSKPGTGSNPDHPKPWNIPWRVPWSPPPWEWWWNSLPLPHIWWEWEQPPSLREEITIVRISRISCLDQWWFPAAWINFLLQCKGLKSMVWGGLISENPCLNIDPPSSHPPPAPSRHCPLNTRKNRD